MSTERTTRSANETDIHALYQQLIDGWNQRSAVAMSERLAEAGEMIGFDGSQYIGRDEMVSNLESIFAQHPTPPYHVKVKSVRFVSPDVAILRAIAGMIPPGKTELAPALNAHHTLVASRTTGDWQIALFQNTPAQFHGQPELVEQMTAELRELL
ncbi:MAG: SgcJ/EcaC family oxidoreductase [Tumebacillaceae bacterium]